MKLFKPSVLVYLFLIFDTGTAYNIIGVNKQILYDYIGSVSVGGKPPKDYAADSHTNPPPSSGWIVKGKLTLQRQSNNTIAAALAIDEVSLNNSGEKFGQNKEMYPPYKPFKIVIADDGKVEHLVFKETDPIWSKNLKRAIASTLQLPVNTVGAFLVDEVGIHGLCSTEYYIANKTDYLTIRKTPELKTCAPFSEAIHLTRSNVPPNICEFDYQKNVIVGNEAIYGLLPHAETDYFVSVVHVKGTTLIHTFESTGEAQYIISELLLKHLNETNIDNPIDIETGMNEALAGLELEPLELSDPTGGRHPQQQETLITQSKSMLNSLAEGLESTFLKFDEPFDSTVSDIIQILSQMDYDSLQKLYSEVDIGTSYRQETIRNIFFEILPRIGTKSSVFLIKDLVMVNKVKPATVVQLLISFPFHIYELSEELVKVCEPFLTLGFDRPDVRQSAVLSYATLIYNVFVAGKISSDVFDDYVQKYINFYLSGHDYEQKMLYLQGLSNLQLGNVANYLDPIIKDENENTDIKFLAAWITMPLAHTRADKVYEIYWPIFESKNSTLELRVAALTLLLVSRPTPVRLISIHRIIQDETCPHLINYYRSTIKSISETTYPCYQHLRRLFSYMNRHLPPAPENRYWVSGNYIFDYRDSKFGIGAMLQVFLVGDAKSDLPVVAFLKFDTEALGKFTGQIGLYLKARGLPDAVLDRILKMNTESLKLDALAEIFEAMHAPKVDYTPLHLEFILQMEGKTVLSYYLNQNTFLNLTYGDLINRLNFIIRADSHINMQTVRWPFMSKYAVPTVLGTSADVLIQTTVLTSLRGNMTQQRAADAITRTHQLDVRYNSYASCKSRSYNPFLNLEHEINREQGVLIYFPINNELSANITDKCLRFSFARPENLISGLSFKSRSVTTTNGYITRSSVSPFHEVIVPKRRQENIEVFKFYTNDLGIGLTVNTNLNELNNYKIMLLKSEFIENGFSKNVAINILMYLFGTAQLSSIHIGNDRNFTLLAHNIDFTKIEGSLCTNEIESSGDQIGHKLILTLVHTNKSQSLENPLHKWNVILNFSSSSKSSKSNWFKLIGIMKRTSVDAADWKACLEFKYFPLVFTKKSHILKGSFIFGVSAGEKNCPVDSSKMEISASASPSELETDYFTSLENTNNNICPRDLLRFDPMPSSKYCKHQHFANVTSISNYNVDLKFRNMPEWFDYYAKRLDHFVSAFSTDNMNRVELGEEISLSLQMSDQYWTTIGINNVSWKLYHVPFLHKFDSNQDFDFGYNTGLKRSCSFIRENINTFDDQIINASQYIQRNNKTCSTFLVGDCSPQPKLAIFLNSFPIDSDSEDYRLGIKVYIGGNYFTFEPSDSTNPNSIFIVVNDNEKINIKGQPYQFPILEKFYDFRVEINEQNILVIENTIMKANIQFDMIDILNIEIFGVYKNKMCGLCSQPLNVMEDYNYCI